MSEGERWGAKLQAEIDAEEFKAESDAAPLNDVTQIVVDFLNKTGDAAFWRANLQFTGYIEKDARALKTLFKEGIFNHQFSAGLADDRLTDIIRAAALISLREVCWEKIIKLWEEECQTE
jgi:hypothetical protein